MCLQRYVQPLVSVVSILCPRSCVCATGWHSKYVSVKVTKQDATYTNRQNQFSVKIDKIRIGTHCFAYILPLILSCAIVHWFVPLPHRIHFVYILGVQQFPFNISQIAAITAEWRPRMQIVCTRRSHIRFGGFAMRWLRGEHNFFRYCCGVCSQLQFSWMFQPLTMHGSVSVHHSDGQAISSTANTFMFSYNSNLS